MPLVTVFGGSGFLGRYVVRRFAHAGWRVRVAVRRPNEALFLRTAGEVGQIVLMQANIRDDTSTVCALLGADAVVNLVGILHETGRQRFRAVHAEGPARILRAMEAAGQKRFVHLSAIGADPASPSRYGRSKAEGEKRILARNAHAHIIRPSLLAGQEDRFFNRFAAMACLTPILALPGLETRFQPVRVDDVAEAVFRAATEQARPGICELGGPEIATMRTWLSRMLGVIHRRRLLVNLPFWTMRFPARIASLLPNPPLTPDQLAMLTRDNVVSSGARDFRTFGMEPSPIDPLIARYLLRFCPRGQYELPLSRMRERE